MQLVTLNQLILKGEICPYCLKRTEYGDSSLFYNKDYGKVYYCLDCRAYVGVHRGTNKAKGRLADAKLRDAKKQAHFYFDNLWRRKSLNVPDDCSSKKWVKICRNLAYEWLSKELNIPRQFCHIGMFDEETCYKVINICKPYYRPSLAISEDDIN